MTTKIQKENRSLEETINASKKLLSSKDKPLDENLTVELKKNGGMPGTDRNHSSKPGI